MPGVPASPKLLPEISSTRLSEGGGSRAFSPNKYFDFYPQSPVFVAVN